MTEGKKGERHRLVERDPHTRRVQRREVVHINPPLRQRRLRMLRHQLRNEIRPDGQLLLVEVEQRREVLARRHLGVRLLEVVEEGVRHRFDGGQAGGGGVFEELGDEVDRFGGSAGAEDLDEGVRLCESRGESVNGREERKQGRDAP